jgi:thioredoxin-related protein
MKAFLGVVTVLFTLIASPMPAAAAELVMVDARACTYCQKFAREMDDVYAASPAGSNAPIRRVSPYKRWPADLAAVRPAPYTPVFILVDGGREVGRFAGYKSPEWFWSKLNPLLARAN